MILRLLYAVRIGLYALLGLIGTDLYSAKKLKHKLSELCNLPVFPANAWRPYKQKKEPAFKKRKVEPPQGDISLCRACNYF